MQQLSRMLDVPQGDEDTEDKNCAATASRNTVSHLKLQIFGPGAETVNGKEPIDDFTPPLRAS